MNTQQIEQVQDVAELKSERVQDGLVAGVELGEEPFGISLKSERVQDGLAAGKGEEGSFTIGLTRFKPLTVNVPALGATVDIHGFAVRLVAG